ncbi:MAG: transposase [Gammaproteobacteria bacterium]|nr:transposase [Gammaproteobacteria bacterium]
MAQYNKEIHHRNSIRLRDYDYTQKGAYFLTICIANKECILGEILDGAMQMNLYGQIVEKEWLKSSEIRPEFQLGEYVVMPNHFHCIVQIVDCVNEKHVVDNRAHEQKEGDQGEGDRRVAPTKNVETINSSLMGPNSECRGDPLVALPSVAHNTMKIQIVPGPKSRSIGAMLAGFKSAVTKRINIIRDTPRVPVWQRNYYEHIIRNDEDYNRIAEYIFTNPEKWQEDTLNPNHPQFKIPDLKC